MRYIFLLGAVVSAMLLAACSPTDTPDETQESAAVAETAQDVEVADVAATEDNPLLMDWTTPFGAPPLDQIEEAHFLPA